MANGHGGYRKPANPAPVSGPGKYSKRTDGQVLSAPSGDDLPYGERGKLLDAQRAAPLPSEGEPPAPVRLPQFGGGEFAGPTRYPDRPVTHGVDIGAGGGPEALSLPQTGFPMASGEVSRELASLASRDASGLLGRLFEQAQIYGV